MPDGKYSVRARVALLLSKPHQVQRRDRTPVQMNLTGSVRSECIAVWRLITKRVAGSTDCESDGDIDKIDERRGQV